MWIRWPELQPRAAARKREKSSRLRMVKTYMENDTYLMPVHSCSLELANLPGVKRRLIIIVIRSTVLQTMWGLVDSWAFCPWYVCRRTEQETQLVSHWKDRFPLPETDFEFLEPVLALRTTMLQMLLENCRTENNSQGPDAMGRTARALRDLVVHREIQAKLARQANSAQVRYYMSGYSHHGNRLW